MDNPNDPAIISIDVSRLRTDLEALAMFGRNPETGGIDRPSFSHADMAARRWLVARLEAVGLKTNMDSAGNVTGLWETGAGPALMIGSHLDSVPEGGAFDGALGVLAGLECVRAMRDAGYQPDCPIEIVATSEEEGRFGGMLGSQALIGCVTPDWLASARDDAGNLLVDCMRAQGLDPEAIPTISRAKDSLCAFLELHVEQGPVLERKGIPVGVVNGISGVFHWTVRFEGQANHAGTTPMDMRNDAFMALALFASAIPRLIRKSGGPDSRLTIGKVDVTPGFAHTVPGQVNFSLVGKDVDNAVMESLANACQQELSAVAAAQGVTAVIERVSWLTSQPCHPDIVSTFQESARELGIETLTMPSGAGHDTQVMAAHVPAGMIFVPSIGGISHAPDECTSWDDIETGANVLLRTAMRISGLNKRIT